MTEFTYKKIKSKKQKRLIKIAAVFLIFSFLVEIIFFTALKIEEYYQDKFFPGIYIGKIKAGGKTKKEVYELLEQFKEKLFTKGITYYANDEQKLSDKNEQEKKVVNIMPQIYAVTDPDLSHEIIAINIETTINQAFSLGRYKNSKNILAVWQKRYNIWQNTQNVNLNYKLNKEELLNILTDNFKNLEKPPINAQFLIDSNFQINIQNEKTGYSFDYKKALNDTEIYLNELNLEPIQILTYPAKPKIKRENLVKLTIKVKNLLDNTFSIKLKNEKQKFEITPIIYKDWISAEKSQENIFLNFKDKDLEKYLETEIKPSIDRTVIEPKFIIDDNKKVSEFTPSQSGLKLNLKANKDKINQEFFNDPTQEIDLIVEIMPPQYNIASINNLGISEILGVGNSNFKGSPQNRRHNIKVGAESLNGILIPPGQEFSVNKALGTIDAQNGYLPELVIKGNKTIPEYGGGLCQIGTTLFRAALSSGLPITERKPHTYRVAYYEPAGTDCTIYAPHPDCRFLNDTENYILIQTKIQGDDLFFEFWGTKDDRKVTKTETVIYNITNPPSTRYIETEDLNPGKSKCIETAHKGADTQFTYKIEYSNGLIKEQEFKSHYKPWQAVCLIGKEKSKINLPE